MNTLEQYRNQIREIDRQLLSLIKKRLGIGIELSEVKRAHGLPTIDADAEQATMNNLMNSATTLGVDVAFAKQLGELLIEQTIQVQDNNKPHQSKDQLLKQIFELTQKLTANRKKVTRFEIGEPNFTPPRSVIRGLISSFQKNKIIGYGSSSGLSELRIVLARELSKEHNRTIDPDQILITPGGRFAVFATIMSFVSQLERIIIPQPTWPAYEECAMLTKGRVIPICTTLEGGWELDMSRLEEEMRKGARMLVLNNPSNPTGKVLGRKRFHEIVELARKYDTFVLSDEVYEKYVRSKPPSIIEEDYADSVYINSFSKQFSLTGWRIAYLVTTKEHAKRIRRIIQTAVTCVPEFIQRAAVLALREGKTDAQRNINSILNKVDLTCRELSKIDVEFYKPEGAFYVFPRAKKKNFDSIKFATQLLKDRQVSVSPGQSFGNYPTFFRLAVSLPQRQIPKAIRSIGQAIESWSE
ncbi:MAG: aminotransferase class I/II-fold pyridoxal phosphate-dependent enzyme [Candidatus Bathyarchaeia archaeon]